MAEALTASFRSRSGDHEHCIWCGTAVVPPELPGHDPALVLRLPAAAFREQMAPLKLGRFFPAGVLSVSGPSPLFRVTQVANDALLADFNPPLAGRQVSLGREADQVPTRPLGEPRMLMPWAGMEAPLDEAETDFDEPDALEREDAGDDALFYASPRLVMHVDEACSSRIAALYGRLIVPGSRVLDLMSSRYSHLPSGLGQVSGLGMNPGEMTANPQLDDHRVQDLNRQPSLPYEDACFDVVVNTVSIEYLVEPIRVLKDVRRVLRPGGILVVTFSNRFFPPKATRLWTRLHPVERLGMAMQWLGAAGFQDLRTLLERGLQRPAGDRYAGRLREMDPLFAVWGRG